MPPRFAWVARAWLIISLMAALLFIAEVGRDSVTARVILKTLPVFGLIGWALSAAHDRYARLIVAGLFFCLIGDELLEIGDDLFVPGLIAFLIGHVWYIAAFLSITRAWKWPRLLPFAAWVVAAYLGLLPNLQDMTLPVAAYVVVIGAMMWRASAMLEDPAARWQWLALSGALLFGLSDTLLAFKKFNGLVIGPSFTVIVLYWLGQLGLAFSVRRGPAARNG